MVGACERDEVDGWTALDLALYAHLTRHRRPSSLFFHNPRTLWEASQVSVTFSWTITEARSESFSGLERGERLSCCGAVLVSGRFGLSSASRPGESNQDAKIEQDRSPLNPGNFG